MKNSPLRIAILGAGGLGVPAAWGLCAEWPNGTALELHIFDGEAIELSNLNRQVLFGHSDLGKNKATVLAERLQELIQLENRPITIFAHASHIPRNDLSQLAEMNCVIEATDSAESKILVNDFCVLRGIAYCYGGAVGTGGLVVPVNAGASGNSPCLRCLFGSFSSTDYENQRARCQTAGILGPVAGYVGFLQAQETIKMLFANESHSNRDGTVIRFSADAADASRASFQASEDCLLGCAIKNRTRLNLSDKSCPATFLYTKLALEQVSPGGVLDVRFDSAETAKSVKASVLEHGFEGSYDFREAELGHLLIKAPNP